MTVRLLHELPLAAATARPSEYALAHKGVKLDYGTLAAEIDRIAAAFHALALQRHERIAVYLPKQFETIISIFGALRAGCVFVPVNPLLKAQQVEHIMKDCSVRLLVTSRDRLAALGEVPSRCEALQHIVVVGDAPSKDLRQYVRAECSNWDEIRSAGHPARFRHVIDADMAAIFYTSGSTGPPKAVVLSHSNMVNDASSVPEYLENRADDRLLAEDRLNKAHS